MSAFKAAFVAAPFLVFAASAASAQTPTETSDAIDTSADRVTIGLGVALTPSYSGARTSEVVPTAAVQGQVSGMSFNTQGTAIYLDVIRDDGKLGWKLQLGPLAQVRFDRTGFIKGTPVEALGKLKTAWEPGGWIGVQRTGVFTSPYDTLSLSASYQHDVGGAHRSYVVSPSLDYDTPLSHKDFASLSVSADYVGKGFGAYYFDITPSQSAASGLAAYSGADRAGWKDWNASLLVAHSITGDLMHGFKVFATGDYQRLLGAYKRSPIVDGAGDANQWSSAVGVGYTF